LSLARLAGGVADEEGDQQDDQEHAERRDLGGALAVQIVAGQLAGAAEQVGQGLNSRPSRCSRLSTASTSQLPDRFVEVLGQLAALVAVGPISGVSQLAQGVPAGCPRACASISASRRRGQRRRFQFP
jgi:hypothetical protein